MNRKTFSTVAGGIFALVALFHLIRIFEDWPVIIADWSVPKSLSWVALVERYCVEAEVLGIPLGALAGLA
jgi:hypothetical protein